MLYRYSLASRHWLCCALTVDTGTIQQHLARDTQIPISNVIPCKGSCFHHNAPQQGAVSLRPNIVYQTKPVSPVQNLTPHMQCITTCNASQRMKTQEFTQWNVSYSKHHVLVHADLVMHACNCQGNSHWHTEFDCLVGRQHRRIHLPESPNHCCLLVTWCLTR